MVRKAKVYHLYIHIVVQKQVLWLEISMRHLVLVRVFYSRNNLLHVFTRLWLVELGIMM